MILMQILVVEDDIRLADALSQILREQKYMVDLVYDGQDGLDYACSGIYDVIILDVMLPKRDGFSVASELRRQNVQTPILLLTAKDSVPDKVTGLDCGADDYMTKPFAPEELLARVRALSRRQGEVILTQMEFEDLILNLGTCDLSCGAKSVRLNFKEFEVMKLLMSSVKTVVPKEDLIVKVWGFHSEAEDNNVEAYISFLRKKLHFLGSKAEIATLRKLGYKLEAKT